MSKVYDSQLNRMLHSDRLYWIDLKNPTKKQLMALAERYDFHVLDVEDCLSMHQSPKLDEYADYLFMVLHVPYYHESSQQVRYDVLNVFIREGVVVTVHDGSHEALAHIFEELSQSEEEKEALMAYGSGYFLSQLLNKLFARAFPVVRELESTVHRLEASLMKRTAHKDRLRDILETKKNILLFKKIIAPQRGVLQQLEHKKMAFFPNGVELYYDDLVDKVERLWLQIENMKEWIEALQDTNESLLTHETNNVIRVLTIFSVMMMPLTVLTGFYGMNITLPGTQNDHFFWFLLAFMLVVLVSMVVFFRFKKWL